MASVYPDSVVAFEDWVDDNPAMPGTGVDIKAATLNPRDDEIEAIQSALGPRPIALNTFAEKKAATSGLQWGYHGGRIVGGNVVRMVSDGYVLLPDNATSYIYYDWDAAEVTSNTVGFPARSFPIAEVTALNAQFTGTFASRDRRTIAIVSSLGGGSTGTFAENSHVVDSGNGVTMDYSCGTAVVHTSIMVFLNGLLQLPTIHYTILEDEPYAPLFALEPTHVIFNSPPGNGDAIYIAFQKRLQ